MTDITADAADRAAQALAEQTARVMYAQDQASRMLGMSIAAVRPGYARLTMRVREDMVNGHRICHGGLIFTLADSAFAFACNSYNLVTVASSGSIEFLRPGALGDELTAEAREVTRGRRTGIYDIVVTNQTGARVALFRGRSHQFEGRQVHEL